MELHVLLLILCGTFRNAQKVKVKKYRVENTPYNVFKWRRNLHMA